MTENSDKKTVVKVVDRAPVWFIGWLFTIGFAKLSFMQGVYALVLWPYYLGVAVLDVLPKTPTV